MTFKNQFDKVVFKLAAVPLDMLNYAFVMVPFCLLLLMLEIISNFDYLLLQNYFKN